MNVYSIKNILVPVDLSETSLNALETAISIARRHKAVIRLLNVLEPVIGSNDDSYAFTFSNHANADVLVALTGAINHSSEIKPTLVQRKGHVIDEIIKTANAEQSDLIVMGTHGASGFREGYIGSNTYGVIKHASCPVLTIPSMKKYTNFKKALFPIRAVQGALTRYDVLGNFLGPNSTLQVLGLSYLKMERETGLLDKIIEEIRERLDNDKVKVNTSWGQGSSISTDVLQYAQLNSTDLIVLTSILDVSAKPNFVGPHIQRLINCSKVPILNLKKFGVPTFA